MVVVVSFCCCCCCLCVVAGGLRIAKFGCAVANNGVGSYSTTRLVSGPYAPMNWAPQSPLSLVARCSALGPPCRLSYINQSHSTTLTIIGHWLMEWPEVSFLVSGLWPIVKHLVRAAIHQLSHSAEQVLQSIGTDLKERTYYVVKLIKATRI